MLAPAFMTRQHEIAVVKTVAQQREGIDALTTAITDVLQLGATNERRSWLLAEKAWHLIQQQRMKNLSKAQLKQAIAESLHSEFNLYQFVRQYVQA